MRSWLLALVLSLSVAPALAGEPPAPERKAQLDKEYALAQDHYKAKRYTEALPLFEEVARELDSPNAMLYVARCLHRMDRHVEAYRAMQRTIARAAEAAKIDTGYEGTRVAAERELPDLEARVGRVTISVQDSPAGLVVEVAGQPLADPSERLVVLPGPLVIEARADGFDPIRQQIDVVAGGLQNVVIRFAAPPAPVPVVPPAPVTTQTGGYVRYAGIGVAGIGVLGFVAFAVGGVLGNRRFDEIEERCQGVRCTNPEDQDDIDEGRTYDIVANVGLVVGAVGVTAGTLMIIFGGPTETTVQAGALPGGASLSLRHRF
jgi:hypothetical protein